MSSVQEIVRDAAVGVGVANTPGGLSAIERPGCAAAIWRRQPPPGFRTWIDGLDPALLPSARAILRPRAVAERVAEICDVSGTPAGTGRERLVEDAAALSGIFASLTRARWLRLRFDVVTTDACRRFHIDTVATRLICTYRGTGTQYGISTDGTAPKRIFTVPAFAPILLRGTLCPRRPASGLLHRSPPIQGTGETRLVLVLDAVDDHEDDI